MTNKPVPVIVGAGLAGLSCAYRLAQKGIRVAVVEKEPHVGGLAASHAVDGLFYDLGPHRFHSRRKEILDLLRTLMGDEILVQQRKSQISLGGRFFVYPLNAANILSNMPKSVLLRGLFDYVVARCGSFFDPHTEDSFETWVRSRFGNTLYEMFFGAYTRKVLGVPPWNISKDWAEQRISLLDLWSAIEKAIVVPKDPPRTYVNHFYYPRQGGIGRIAEVLRDKIVQKGSQVFLGARITRVHCEASPAGTKTIRSLSFTSGGVERELEVSRFMSTVPITLLPQWFGDPGAQEKLPDTGPIKFRALIFAYLVLPKDLLSDSQWIYLPEDQFFSNRISEPRNFSKWNVPAGRTVVCAEISCDEGDEKWCMEEDEIKRRVVQDVERLGLGGIDEGSGVNFFCRRVSYCYPVYEKDYQEHLRPLKDYLERFENLDYFGRNGSFQYANMDEVMEMGLRAADRFLACNGIAQGEHETEK